MRFSRSLLLLTLMFTFCASADRAALFAACLKHVDDDTPRLVLADFLEENGEAQYAEFIRRSCAFVRMVPKGQKYREERDWVDKTASVYGKSFLPKGYLDRVEQMGIVLWSRGFPEVSLPSHKITKENLEDIAKVPIARLIVFGALSSRHLSDLASSPLATTLPQLSLEDFYSFPAEGFKLADYPSLVQLVLRTTREAVPDFLDLYFLNREPTSLKRLAISGHDAHRGHMEGLGRVFESPALLNLEALNLRGYTLPDLPQKNALPHLKGLSVSVTTPSELIGIVSNPLFRKLAHFSAWGTFQHHPFAEPDRVALKAAFEKAAPVELVNWAAPKIPGDLSYITKTVEANRIRKNCGAALTTYSSFL